MTIFVWDGDQLVMELSDSGKVQKRYIRGNDRGYGSNLVYADKGENTEKQYYVTDPHGNAVQLTGENGAVIKTYEYDSFGNEVKLDRKDDNPFRYCGEYYDKETEEIYLRARYYQSEAGRFLTKDTYTGEEDEPLSLHLYTYCENDGVNAWDPSGHIKFYYGRAKAPKYEFDDDFPYASKRGQQTFMDYVNWAKWEMILGGSKLLKLSLKEANMLYQHYRSGTGKKIKLDYEKANKEDSYYWEKNQYLIKMAQKNAIKFYKKKRKNRFFMYSGKYKIENGENENWQKSIGEHRVWANCIVIRGKRDMFSMCIIIGFRDKYNFNRGQKDIVSGAPDDQNGRFEELGWARSFETYGAMVKCIKWKKYSSKYQIKTNAKR